MKLDKSSMYLYAVTDSQWLGERTLAQDVEKAILGGATFVQLREKTASVEDFIVLAKEVQVVCKKYNVPFVINDNIEVALEVNADGIHVGQADLTARAVREKMGIDKIIGVSAGTVEEARLAQEAGADYIGVGAVFQTSTKLDAGGVSISRLKEICSEINLPVVAIGGISFENVGELTGTGIDGVAVVSAIFAQEDIVGATKAMVEKLKGVVN